MRLPAWRAHVGPAVLAAALVPTLLGALLMVAPRPSGVGGTAGVGGPSAEPPAIKRYVRVTRPTTAESLPMLPCTPLRGLGASHAADVPVAVEGLLSARGEYVGRRLGLRARRGAEVVIGLPAESFVGRPAGDWLVYGTANRRQSEIRAIDLETGCDAFLARVSGVARSAVLDREGASLYVHTVEAGSRADGGVTRIDLATGEERQALPPFVAEETFGRVFATTLTVSVDGATLAVQSCGAQECHTRLLGLASGAVETYRDGHGALVGVTEEALIVFAAGHERPAALLAIARDGAAATVLEDEAYDAQLVEGATPLVRVETSAGWQEVQP